MIRVPVFVSVALIAFGLAESAAAFMIILPMEAERPRGRSALTLPPLYVEVAATRPAPIRPTDPDARGETGNQAIEVGCSGPDELEWTMNPRPARRRR